MSKGFAQVFLILGVVFLIAVLIGGIFFFVRQQNQQPLVNTEQPTEKSVVFNTPTNLTNNWKVYNSHQSRYITYHPENFNLSFDEEQGGECTYFSDEKSESHGPDATESANPEGTIISICFYQADIPNKLTEKKGGGSVSLEPYTVNGYKGWRGVYTTNRDPNGLDVILLADPFGGYIKAERLRNGEDVFFQMLAKLRFFN